MLAPGTLSGPFGITHTVSSPRWEFYCFAFSLDVLLSLLAPMPWRGQQLANCVKLFKGLTLISLTFSVFFLL